MTTLNLKNETIEAVRDSKLPSWVTFIGSVVITALLTGILSTWASSSGQDARIDQNTQAIKNINQGKVNKEELERVDKRLDRMEDKIDRIIDNQNQFRKEDNRRR